MKISKAIEAPSDYKINPLTLLSLIKPRKLKTKIFKGKNSKSLKNSLKRIRKEIGGGTNEKYIIMFL